MRGPTSDHVTSHHQLLEKIRARTATVGVIGLGYVGLYPGTTREEIVLRREAKGLKCGTSKES